MLQTLLLLLPALIPSWRFFDTIAPSPRIEFMLLQTPQDIGDAWQEFLPRPAQLSVGSMLKRMLWNPHWNEYLFLVSCAERPIESPTEHSCREILKRIKNTLQHNKTLSPYLQFRLVFVSRSNSQLEKKIRYVSKIYSSESIDK